MTKPALSCGKMYQISVVPEIFVLGGAAWGLLNVGFFVITIALEFLSTS